jgi:hypothetical protein
LNLLAAAAARIKARQAVLDLDSRVSAHAAVTAKGGASAMKQLRGALEKQSRG